MLRLIGKWLNAGVLEDGGITYPEAGTPQGGVISPLLANIYLHEVLDVWFDREVEPRLYGQGIAHPLRGRCGVLVCRGDGRATRAGGACRSDSASTASRCIPTRRDESTFVELFASSSRVDWAVLLQRTFGFDALRCPKCAAKMRIVATVTDPASVERVLTHIGVRTEPLPRARARDPTGQTAFGFDAA